jgi:hypothetical protein
MVNLGVRSIAALLTFWVLGGCASADSNGAPDGANDTVSTGNGGGLGPMAPAAPIAPAPSPAAPVTAESSGNPEGSPPEGNAGLGGIGLGSDPGGAGDTPGGSTGAQTPGEVATGPGDCTSLPAISDYGAPGPFGDAKMFTSVGPNGNYTLFRPDGSLGKDGFRHPIATWGNGIATTPDQYQKTLTLIASHGFVIIACNDTQAERPCLSDGLDWLVEQDSAAGALQGKLDITREVTVGYSWGGGAAIDTADRPNVKATVSLHGMPPRVTSAFDDMHSPLLLFTSTGDSFVTAAGYVTPNYEKSTVQTFYATLEDSAAGHLYVVDEGAAVCIGGVLGLGACATAAEEQAPTIAWLRYWACGDQNAARFFFGDDCTLCSAPWTQPERKEFP